MDNDEEDNIKEKKISILCVDDSKSQLEKYKIDLKNNFNLFFSKSYYDAISLITVSPPDIILLDINMPGIDGLQFLDIIKNHPVFKDIEIIMISSNTDIDAIQKSFVSGASDYIKKPYNSIELNLRINNVIKLLEEKRLNDKYKKKSEYIQNKNKIIVKEAKNSIVFALTELAKSRDNETGWHLKRIMKYTLFLSELLSHMQKFKIFFNEETIEDIYTMSALHDIGKIAIPDYILKKSDKLTEDEYNIMKNHTTIGGKMLENVYKSNKNCEYLKTAIDISLYHHEKWNGKGYPFGVQGDLIPVAARIVAIADIFDALSTKRVYKEAFDTNKVFEIMKSEKNITFDPFIYDVFEDNKDAFVSIKNTYSSEE